jgi:hypothetical protein
MYSRISSWKVTQAARRGCEITVMGAAKSRADKLNTKLSAKADFSLRNPCTKCFKWAHIVEIIFSHPRSVCQRFISENTRRILTKFGIESSCRGLLGYDRHRYWSLHWKLSGDFNFCAYGSVIAPKFKFLNKINLRESSYMILLTPWSRVLLEKLTPRCLLSGSNTICTWSRSEKKILSPAGNWSSVHLVASHFTSQLLWLTPLYRGARGKRAT